MDKHTHTKAEKAERERETVEGKKRERTRLTGHEEKISEEVVSEKGLRRRRMSGNR